MAMGMEMAMAMPVEMREQEGRCHGAQAHTPAAPGCVACHLALLHIYK